MPVSMEFIEQESNGPKIKVIGVGTGGNNTINSMIEKGLTGVDFIAANTDLNDLKRSKAKIVLQLGKKITRGLGAGANSHVGRLAAEETINEIIEILDGADLVFIIAGLGGGTGTGAAPIIAELARKIGIITVAIVTMPFNFEGEQRKKKAEKGAKLILNIADTLIIIPNDSVVEIEKKNNTVIELFEYIDEIAIDIVKCIADLTNQVGMINADFNDIRTIMFGMGIGAIGIGTTTGVHRAIEATELAINYPLFKNAPIEEAECVLVTLYSSPDLAMTEIQNSISLIQREISEESDLIWGWIIDKSYSDKMKICILATGMTVAKTSYKYLSNSNDNNESIPEKGDVLKSNLSDEIDFTYYVELLKEKEAWLIGYDIFSLSSTNIERAKLLKAFRDAIIEDVIFGNNINQNSWEIIIQPKSQINIINGLWRLASNPAFAPNYSRIFVDNFKKLNNADQYYELFLYYLFIIEVVSLRNFNDIETGIKLFLKQIDRIIQYNCNANNDTTELIHKIKEVLIKLNTNDDSIVERPVIKNCKEKLINIKENINTINMTPEELCVKYYIDKWVSIFNDKIDSYLNKMMIRVYPNQSIIMGKRNKLLLIIVDGPREDICDFKILPSDEITIIHTPKNIIFTNGNTEISVELMPHRSGKISIEISIDNLSYEIDIFVFIENPFVVGIPLDSSAMFVGREILINDIIRSAQGTNPNHYIIAGRKRTGKSSLLKAIDRETPKNILPVIINPEGSNPVSYRFYEYLCQIIASKIQDLNLDVQSINPMKINDIQNFQIEIINWLKELKKYLDKIGINYLLLMVDEAKILLEYDIETIRLFRFILGEFQWIRVVLATPMDLLRRIDDTKNDDEIYLFNYFMFYKLTPLTDRETFTLLEKGFLYYDIDNIEYISKEIYEYTGGYPYYVQAMGRCIVDNYLDETRDIKINIDISKEKIKHRLMTSYPATIMKLPPNIKIPLVCFYNNIKIPDKSIKTLLDADLIRLRNDSIESTSVLEKEWVLDSSEMLLESAVQEILDFQDVEISIDEIDKNINDILKNKGTRKIITILKAKEAIDQKDKKAALKWIIKTGKQIFDATNKISAELLTAYLKDAFGLK